MFNKFKRKWEDTVNREHGQIRANGGNKLRNYRQFKTEFTVEPYVKCSTISRAQRSALAKFRCGVAPLRIETGRYEGVPENERYCFICKTCVESEEHALMMCPLYENIRSNLTESALLVNQHFNTLNPREKMNFLLSDDRIIKPSARACHDILMKRRNHMYI